MISIANYYEPKKGIEGRMSDNKREVLVERLMVCLGSLKRGSGAIFREAIGKHGVTLPQFYLLMMVSHHEGTTVTEISRLLQVAPPTASRMIENLCSKGLLARKKDPGDHRVTFIEMTRKGRKVLEDMADYQKRIFMRTLEKEDIKDLKNLVELLDRFSRKLAGELDKE